MSQAFVKEEDGQWLHDIQPTVNALIVYLTRENNGIRVYEQKTFFHPKEKKEVHQMSNGLNYAKDDEGKVYSVVRNTKYEGRSTKLVDHDTLFRTPYFVVRTL